MDYTAAFPGPSGEWGQMGIFLAYVVDIPAGVISLIIGFTVKHGNNRLRRLCLIAAVVTLCLPLIGDGIHRYRTRWRYGVAHTDSRGIGRTIDPNRKAEIEASSAIVV